MKTPEFLEKLSPAAYRQRLKADLAQLQELKDSAEGNQNFFLIVDYTFQGEKEGLPVLVVGLTNAWRDFIKQRRKQRNFAAGECSFSDATLNLDISTGKAKGAEIRKTVGKTLKKLGYELNMKISDEEDLEEEMAACEETLNSIDNKKKNILGIESTADKDFERIRQKVEEYKALNPKDLKGRKDAIKEIQNMIQVWNGKHLKDKGEREQKMRQGLIELGKSLQQQLDIIQQRQTAEDQDQDTQEIFALVREEYLEVRNFDIESATQKELQNFIQKECKEVLDEANKWQNLVRQKPGAEQNPKIQGEFTQIRRMLAHVGTLRDQAQTKLKSGDFAEPCALMQSIDFLKQADTVIKGSEKSYFDPIIQRLEALEQVKGPNGKLIDAEIKHLSFEQPDESYLQTLEQSLKDKIKALDALDKQAAKWLEKVADNSIIKANNNEAKERHQRKKAAVEKLRQSIQAETERCITQSKEVHNYQAVLNTKKANKVSYETMLAANKKKQTDIVKAKEENEGDEVKALRQVFKIDEDKDTNYALEEYLKLQELEKLGSNPKAEEVANMVPELLGSYVEEQMLTNQAARDNILFAFRSDNTLTKMISYVTNNQGEELAASFNKDLVEASDNQNFKGPSFRNGEDKKTLEPESEALLIEYVTKTLLFFDSPAAVKKVSPKLTAFCRELFKTFVDKGQSKQAALDAIKGLVILRFINPLITQTSIAVGTKSAGGELLMQVSKIVQNHANRTMPSDDYLKKTAEETLMYAQAIDNFVARIVDSSLEGEVETALKAIKGDKDSRKSILEGIIDDVNLPEIGKLLNHILSNGKRYKAFHIFCGLRFTLDELEAYLMLKRPKGSPKAFYQAYLAPKSPKEVNISGKLQASIQAPSDDDTWDDVAINWPFDDLVTAVENNLTEVGQQFIAALADGQSDYIKQSEVDKLAAMFF